MNIVRLIESLAHWRRVLDQADCAIQDASVLSDEMQLTRANGLSTARKTIEEVRNQMVDTLEALGNDNSAPNEGFLVIIKFLDIRNTVRSRGIVRVPRRYTGDAIYQYASNFAEQLIADDPEFAGLHHVVYPLEFENGIATL